ncbi:transcription factor TFIIIC subunit tfc4 [Coemansia erecta]|nr:transcription factor TFIIIC subunit tfc4 [Coemansia erecta]KAJ2889246.1 transcription factor TFIIIC subunit tfc4 [Coemansia asiatica]
MSFNNTHITNNNDDDEMLDINAENDAMLDEARLINAVRSATEMLAAEGLGSMVDIDLMQSNSASLHTQTMEWDRAQSQSHQDIPGATFDDSDNRSEYSDEEEEQEDGLGQSQDQMDTGRAARSANLRASGSRNINYSEMLADVLVEDDEDSDFDESEASAASSDVEYHMRQYEDEARFAAGFSRSKKSTNKASLSKGQKKRGQAKNIGIQRKRNHRKPRQRKTPKYSIEVQRLLGIANQCYVEHDLVKAFNTFCDVIRLDPYCGPAWNTMALIREEEGRYDDALQLYTVSAHLNPSESSLWDRLYSMHMTTVSATEEAARAGDPIAKAKYGHAMDQALYCISFVNRNDPLDKAAWMNKMTVLEKQENYKGMAKAYKTMLKNDPYDMETIRMAAVVFAKKCDNVEMPIKWFSEAFAFYNRQAIEVAEDAASRAKGDTARKSHRGGGGGGAFGKSDDEDEEEEEDYDPEWAEYFQSNPTKTVPMEELGGYSYNDINMMAELRILRNEYEAAVVDIKRGSRFIQSRGREQQWEDQELIDENDEEYTVDPENPELSANALPIELRVKLGQCRLALGYHATAQMHIEPLFSLDVVAYEDLYVDVAETYAETGNVELALGTYQRLMDREETNQPSLWERMAKCYRELGNMDEAQEYAEAVVQADPSDIDMRLWLAEVYEESGQVDKAYNMIQIVEGIQEEERREQVSADSSLGQSAEAAAAAAAVVLMQAGDNSRHGLGQQLSLMEIWEAPSSVVQIDKRKPSEIAIRRRREAEEERKRCIMAMRNAEVAFKKLDLLKPAIDESQDAAAVREYCATAQRLYNDWRHMRAFVRSDRNKPFVMYRSTVMASLESCAVDDDLDARSVSSGQATVQRRLTQMKRRLSKRQKRADTAANMEADGGEDREETAVATTFRGQPFDRWFDMFLLYGKCLCLDGEPESALDMLDLVFQSSVFCAQSDKRLAIRLVMLSIAIRSNALDRLYDLVRWWCGSQPNKAVMYKIMGYAMSGSAAAMVTLTSANMYKYVRRQLKELNDIFYADKQGIDLPVPDGRLLFRDHDADESDKIVSSISRVRRQQRELTKGDIAAMHTVAAHVMLVARTGVASIMQYTLALSLTPQDPSVALHLGAAYLMHSTQRRTRDAQAMAIRGLAFIQRYAELQCVAELRARGTLENMRGRAGNGVLDVVVTQEIAFNFARAFHFLGMLDLAIDNYMRVFSLPVSQLAAGADDKAASDLRSEAAYNLAAICIASGAVTQARGLLKRYCTI